MIIFTPPWKQHPLDKWNIETMGHKDHTATEINVVMSRIWPDQDRYERISESGPDNNEIWRRLYEQAMKYET